ncbi:MAG: serine/threonine protein kinase [Azospirillaceae bacterium]|nr:serine/threonine protein kinase [Azospirillaceae bacterium]
MAAEQDSLGSDLGPIDLGGRAEIQPGAPLPAFDTPGGRAYLCHRAREKKTELFAIVCDRSVPPRIDAMSSFRAIDNNNLLHLMDWGVVDWSPENRRRFVCVFERPSGRRIMERLDDVIEGVADDALLRVVMPQLATVLRDIAQRSLICGALNPTNLFIRESAAAAVVLGDCVSLPPGYAQPLMFEPLERALADRNGRGNGTIADDLFALGVTLLTLYLGRAPARGMDEQSLLQARMDRGTYATLTAGVRVPQSLVEPLRGLITDDPRQRWTLNDLDMWMQGRRLSPKQAQLPKRAPRPLEFQGKEIWHVRGAAWAFSKAPIAAAQIIERGDLDRWLRRSLNDEARADSVTNAIRSATSGGRASNMEERLVARVCTALDPTAPLRYKGRAIMPDGFGSALAEGIANGEGGQAVAEMITGQLPAFWISVQAEYRPEQVLLIHQFDAVRAVLENTSPGFGIERALYSLNQMAPCYSPTVADWYALTLGDLMAALDAAETGGTTGRDPMDRHVAAFIATRNPKLNERLLATLAAESARRPVGVLAILADTQRRAGPPKVPGLATWMTGILEPSFKRFRNLRKREEVRQAAQKAAREGVLDALLSIVDDPKALTQDHHGFIDAMRKHEGLTARIGKIEDTLGDRSEIAASKGKRVAAMVASGISLAGLAVIVTLMAGLK